MNIRIYPKGKGGRQPLIVSISHHGKRYRKALGISVSSWNATKGTCGHIPTDKAIRLIRIGLESVLDEFSTESDIASALDRIVDGKWSEDKKYGTLPKSPSFDEFFKSWSERDTGAKRQNTLTYRTVTGIMGNGYKWSDIDSAYYSRLKQGMDKKGFRPNYQGVLIGRLKTCLNEAYALHYIDNADFREWAKPHEETFAIALTQDEVDKLWKAKLTGNLAKTRDLAIIGIYTAARFSDYSRITIDNIHDGRISFVQTKTGSPVLIPCSPKITAVLERNNGFAPQIAIQHFNERLKKLCKAVGIDDVVEVPKGLMAKLGKKDGEKVYKWELVSSHTCRRTGASLLYKSGVPIRVCRYLTGHTKDDTFLKYIKIDREEGADILAKNEFFK